MQYLTRVASAPDASWYEVGGDYQGDVRRWVVSTPWSRDICNRPELLGCEYTAALRSAMVAALAAAPFRDLVASTPPTRVCVLHFLRGGLNFDLRNALHEAYGLNALASVFMSSQRFRVEGRWQVREDMYRKLQVPPGAVLLAADVVATGVTVANGLEVVLEHVRQIGSSIRALVFFTIGCHKLEKCLAALEPRLREASPDYLGSHVVYLEGKLRLVDSRTPLRVGIPGTDLIRREALLAPELEASQLALPSAILERCAIYDAGSRAFDVPAYVEDVLDYWRKVRSLARYGLTLADALAERWPAPEYASRELFLAHKRATWRGVDDASLDAVWQRHRELWTDDFAARARTAEALEEICAERIATLERTLEH